MTRREPSARTALSHSFGSKSNDLGHLWAVARQSHWLRAVLALSALTPLSATGCIVADAPDYGSPQRSSILMYNPVPTNPASLQALTRNDPSPTAYGATTKSEDAGEQFVAIYVVDYKHANERFLDTYVMPAYTFE